MFAVTSKADMYELEHKEKERKKYEGEQAVISDHEYNFYGLYCFCHV